MNQAQILEQAEILWNFHQMKMPLQAADCILVLGSHDLRVAEYGAQLYLDGWAPWLMFSGGLGRLTREIWNQPEAEKFAQIALQMGVPRARILIENQSTNTGENIAFSRRLLAEHQLDFESLIVVQKPYMERRVYAAFCSQWPEESIDVTSPPISFRNYPNEEISVNEMINIMVGDFQRIVDYPKLGYQIAMDVPPDAEAAFQALVSAGYDQQLLRLEIR